MIQTNQFKNICVANICKTTQTNLFVLRQFKLQKSILFSPVAGHSDDLIQIKKNAYSVCFSSIIYKSRPVFIMIHGLKLYLFHMIFPSPKTPRISGYVSVLMNIHCVCVNMYVFICRENKMEDTVKLCTYEWLLVATFSL